MKSSKRNRLPRCSALALVVWATWGLSAWALPQGATVVNGQVAIQQPTPGTQVINASNGAIIHWQQFSIGRGETTQFVQPSSASAVLNRVVGSDPSSLLGQLRANGQVFLINPNGIVIGGAARIDTNSFIASTLDIADRDFIAGKLRFFAGPDTGRIRNEGLITSGPGGRIALIAPDIENTGIIRAADGQILLAAGRKLEITSLDLEGVTFEIQAPTDSVLNLGQLLAENGAVRAFAGNLRHSGEVRASRMVRDADGSIVLAGSNDLVLTADSITNANGMAGGAITLQSSGGTARISGQVLATGAEGAGGDVRILGERVALDAGARVDVSGSTGGGQILVGGDLQGRNTLVQNATRTHIAAGARLVADATDQGDGGRVIIWADQDTRYAGHLSARGGLHGGDGGFAEVSGKANLQFMGSASLVAPQGASGTLLLDPLDLIVSSTSGLLPTVADEFTDFIGNVVTVAPSTLAAVGANVVLQAERDVYVKDAIALSAPGAGISITAGGATFANGSIFNTAGISTVGGAVTLRGQSITGGSITTSGGAVDLLAHGSLGYSGSISSGGGAVTLASQFGSVSNASVQAGAGTIGVTAGTLQVSGQSSVSGGDYTTSGTATLTAARGSVQVNGLNVGTANLSASGSIYATVNASDRVNATSTGSFVQLFSGSGPLRLGTVDASSGIYLYASTGLVQAPGGVLTSPYFQFSLGGGSVASGSPGAPLLLAAPSPQIEPRIQVYGMEAPIHLAFSGSPTIGGLLLDGAVAAIGGSTVAAAGSANLTSLSLSAAGGVLGVSAVATGGFGNGFELNANDGAIQAGTLTFPDAPVELTAAGPVSIGTMTGGSLSLQAQGPVTITSAATSGSSGISVFVQSCDFGTTACLNQSPITAGTLAAGGTGDVNLTTYDNGDITVTNLSAGDRIDVEAGQQYRTSSFSQNYTDQPTTNNIVLGTVVSVGRTFVENQGQGNVTVTSLSAGDRVDLRAGTSFTPVAFTSQRTNNTITVGNLEPVGAIDDFRVSNSGIGDITVTGAVDRTSSGDIILSTFNGSVTALGSLSARDSISVTSGGAASTLSVGTLTAGTASFNGTVNLSAGANLVFDAITSTAPSVNSGTVTLTSTNGSIRTALDNTDADIVASGNVTLTASQAATGVIGEASFTNPLDIQAGTGRVVTLTAGLDVGALGKPVTVDADGSLIVSAANGQFHVAATDGTTERSLSTIRLSGSAAGVGAGNTATFRSLDLDVIANSDGSTLGIGDLVRSTGTLNEFQFFATGTSALTYGNVNLTSTGLNQVVLNATQGLAQNTPLTNSITAGTVTLAAGTGALSVGDITARSVRLSGGEMALRSVTTTGTSRSNFGATPDTLTVASSGDVNISGALNSATVIDVSSSGDLVVGGAVTGTGSTRGTFRAAPDQVRLQASGDITTGGAVTSQTSTAVLAGGSVLVGGAGIDGGTVAPFGSNLNDAVTVTAGMSGSINTQAITDGYSKTVTGGTLIVPGGITGATQSTTVTGTNFNTGNISTASTLTINATASYVPGAPIALTAASTVIDASGGIDLRTSGTALSSPTVTLRAGSGNIEADLTGTTSLTVNAGGTFQLSSSAALSNLNVTADGALAGAGAGSSVSANDGGQLLGYVATGNSLALQMQSDAGLTNRYTESSTTVTDLVLGSTGTFIGAVTVSAPAANIGTPSLASTGSVNLSTGDGDISLTSLTAAGGVNVFTSTGHVTLTDVQSAGGSVVARTTGDASRQIRVERIQSVGGSVSLTADSGSIVRAGAQALQIDSRNGQGLASGTMTLSAAAGSIGTAAAPILTSGASNLTINGRDEIAVDAANTPVANLNITTAASGTQAVSVTNANFAGLSIQRVGGTDLELGALNPGTTAGFSLTATDGNIRVTGNLANFSSLTLNAGRNINNEGDLIIQASSGPLSVSANSYDMQAGRDIRIAAGPQAADDVSISQSGNSGATNLLAGRDISVLASGGSALLAHSGTNSTQTLSAGRDISVSGGTTPLAGATAAITAVGFQTLSATGNLTVQAGSADQSSARIEATQSQNMTNVLGTLSVLGGSGADAFAEIVSSVSSQSMGTTSSVTDLVLVQGGTGVNSTASIRAATSQTILSSGDVRVMGGSGAGSDAALVAGTSQTIGSTSVPFNFFNDPTNAILVQAGSGGTARILAGSTQTVRGSEGLSVLGGSTTGMFASIETTGGTQSIGTSSTNQNNPTGDIVLQAGAGDGAFASIKASSTQTISTGGIIDVLGGTGAGAFAEILSTAGGQTIGSTSTSNNDPTGSIMVRAGTGGIARIQAQGNQTIRSGGDLSVIGGDASNLTASIVSVGGSQTIGQTGIFSNDASGSILVQAGTATGAAAFITASTGQTIDAGGTISLVGNLAGGSALISTTTGFQSIGNASCCSTDQTDSITLTGGSAAGSFARMSTGGSQNISTSGSLTLAGGAGDATGALLLAGSGQTVTAQGDLTLTGGTASAAGLNETGIRNTNSGSQTVLVSGQVALTGGGVGSDTWIRQNGTGSQLLNIGTDLALLAPVAGTGAGETSIVAMGSSQSLQVGGSISIDNQGGTSALIGTSGAQDISAQALAISLSSAVGATPFAGVTANGDQSITLHGDGMTAGTATLSLQNLSAATNSLVVVRSLGALEIQMNYDAAGLIAIGNAEGLGATTIAALGDLTIVAGELRLQGGATAAADAKLLAGAQPPAAATNNMLISTLYGPVELLGGSAGGAFIDPLELNIVSNGSVLMQAGLGSTANTNITAGTVNMAPTTGGLSLVNSSTSSATSTITAGTFNLFAPGNLILNGGTISVVNPSTIGIAGVCFGCETNLLPLDLFTLQAGSPPPPANFGAEVAGDILALGESSIDMFELAIDENGDLVFTRRRLNQCY